MVPAVGVPPAALTDRCSGAAGRVFWDGRGTVVADNRRVSTGTVGAIEGEGEGEGNDNNNGDGDGDGDNDGDGVAAPDSAPADTSG